MRQAFNASVTEGSFRPAAEYLFRRSRRHFVARCVNSRPQSAPCRPFICTRKYSLGSVVRARACSPLFSRPRRRQFRKLGHFANTRSLVCDAAASPERLSRPFGSRSRREIPKCVTIDTSHVAVRSSMGNPGIDRLTRPSVIASRRSFPPARFAAFASTTRKPRETHSRCDIRRTRKSLPIRTMRNVLSAYTCTRLPVSILI